MTPQQFTDQTIAKMKAEILADIAAGRVDAGEVAGFSDLHDFVDANCYGGMDTDDWLKQGNQLFPAAEGEDPEVMFSEALIAAINTMQDAVDAWIRSDEFTTAQVAA